MIKPSSREKPKPISNLHYGFKMKLGIKSKSIFGLYRVSHFLENSDIPNY